MLQVEADDSSPVASPDTVECASNVRVLLAGTLRFASGRVVPRCCCNNDKSGASGTAEPFSPGTTAEGSSTSSDASLVTRLSTSFSALLSSEASRELLIESTLRRSGLRRGLLLLLLLLAGTLVACGEDIGRVEVAVHKCVAEG